MEYGGCGDKGGKVKESRGKNQETRLKEYRGTEARGKEINQPSKGSISL